MPLNHSSYCFLPRLGVQSNPVFQAVASSVLSSAIRSCLIFSGPLVRFSFSLLVLGHSLLLLALSSASSSELPVTPGVGVGVVVVVGGVSDSAGGVCDVIGDVVIDGGDVTSVEFNVSASFSTESASSASVCVVLRLIPESTDSSSSSIDPKSVAVRLRFSRKDLGIFHRKTPLLQSAHANTHTLTHTHTHTRSHRHTNTDLCLHPT